MGFLRLYSKENTASLMAVANGGANGGAILVTSNEDTINRVKQIIYNNAGINSKKSINCYQK